MTGVSALTDPARWPGLAVTLSPWVTQQRWFQGKARELEALVVADAGVVNGETDVLVVLADARYRDGHTERYQVPLVAHGGAVSFGSVDDQPIADALHVPGGARTLAHAVVTPADHPTQAGGTLRGEPVVTDVALDGEARLLGVEQSNSSVVFGEALLLKLFRRIEPGINPDVELTRMLTERAFPHVPPQVGALVLAETTTTSALAVLTVFRGRAREGWDLACADVEAARRGGASMLLEGHARTLGDAVGRMHLVLREGYGQRRASPTDLKGWAEAMIAQAEDVLETAARRAPEIAERLRLHEERLHAAFRTIATLEDAGELVRTHGDLHLGQVLLDPQHGWQILDFEGEPARGLAERRAPHSPLRDVAGMLRSFDYAAAHGTDHADPQSDPAVVAWRDALRHAFLEGYEDACGDAALLPAGGDAQTLRGAFELDKAVYELAYELANRPTWVRIPASAIERLLVGETPPAARGEGATVANRPSDNTTPTQDWPAHPDEVDALLAGEHREPHAFLGPHETKDGAVVRVYRPDADAVEIVVRNGPTVDAERTHEAGFFEAQLDARPDPGTYTVRVRYGDEWFELVDPYAFPASLGDIDLHLAGEGRHEELWRRLGAHVSIREGIRGTTFAVWAPNAQGVRVVGDFNSWDGRLHPMRMLGDSGIWELFVPDVGEGVRYKYELVTTTGRLVTRADPFAFWAEVPPGNASRVFASSYEWGDEDWFTSRADQQAIEEPLSIYEVHLGSWRRGADGEFLNYRDIAHALADHVEALGFTHVQLLPVAEHPFGGSWGYQVSGYYAPTSRFGSPDDFRYFVDYLHQRGIGVIVDWVPAHFPRDEFALARFDGTALYEHADPRKGEHPDWGTLVFNFGRNEVRNFLIANALYWLEELHVDGLRVDAVASMLYLDYSRGEGQWVPNEYGGRENLEAVEFLQELNRVVYGRNPQTLMIAEESTAWPGVTKPVHLGGLGFGFKWNMGWMHDTLSYMGREPVYRKFHHSELTFGFVYAWSEHFVLPLSHDEVVHGKRSMLDKMPGDRWQKFANLRALYAWMWAHPGKQLLFMGSEFGQWREWSEERELDWYVRDEHDHAGLERLLADINRTYRDHPALWVRDNEPAGFRWIDPNDAANNVLSFIRFGDDEHPPLVCVANLSPQPREHLRIGLPQTGRWREVLNTDAEVYGGGNVGNLGAIEAVDLPWHDLPASADIVAPPLASVWLTPAD